MKPHELLRAYAQDHSEPAFQELVNRYVDLVYSAAIRRVSGDRQLAEDVTQEVFADLARKAAALQANVMLGGWLLRHTGYVASTALRGDQRRRDRERQAAEMNALNEPSEAGWSQFAPILDEAMDELDAADRDALVLRYFERWELREVGAALGVSEDTAQKRISRALEKLHVLLKHRGATLSAAALGTALATEAVTAAPAGLAGSIAATGLACAAASAGVTGTLVKLMTMTKLKVSIISVIAVAGVATSLGVYKVHRAALRRGDTQRPQHNVVDDFKEFMSHGMTAVEFRCEKVDGPGSTTNSQAAMHMYCLQQEGAFLLVLNTNQVVSHYGGFYWTIEKGSTHSMGWS